MTAVNSRGRKALAAVAGLAVSAGLTLSAAAQPIDFSTFVEWQSSVYFLTNTFATPNWQVRDGGASVTNPGNSNVSIFYNGSIELNGNRLTGTFTPGSDDDMVGFVFGYTNADDIIFDPAGTADWLMVDWKGVDQPFNFVDIAANAGLFHDLTGETFAAEGMRLARASGLPTADELWGAVNLPENDSLTYVAPGGLEQLARANDLFRRTYDRNATDGLDSYTIDVDLTPSNIKVWINGALQFDVNAPVGRPFQTTGFGVIEQYQDSGAVPDQGFWTNFAVNPNPGVPPTGSGVGTIDPGAQTFSAGFVDFILESRRYTTAGGPPDADLDGIPDEDWYQITFTGTTSPLTQTSPDNRGDLAFGVGTQFIYAYSGLIIPTIAENRSGEELITAEAFQGNAFGGSVIGHQVALSPSPDNRGTGNEANADFTVAYFPYSEGWQVAFVLPSGTITDGVAATVVNRVTPDANDQDGIYDVTLPGGQNPTQGMMFVTGGSNEDNVAAVAERGGFFRVGVRDSYSTQFGGAQTFERDDFAFVFLPDPALAGSTPTAPVAAQVTGFDANGNAQTAQTWGGYTLTRTGTGVYRLSIPGENAQTGMLLLTSNAEVTIDDPNAILADDIAPTNYWLSYQPDGNDFVIQMLELGTLNTVVDGAFSFAFLPFEAADPCPVDLNDDGSVNIFDIFAFFGAFGAGDLAVADFTADGTLNIFDIFAFFNLFGAGC